MNLQNSAQQSAAEERLVQQLRAEAESLKDCFTKYCFQGIASASIVLVAIARFEKDVPWVGVAAVLPIVIMFCVVTIGLHKYATVNRLLGYELHLQRTKRLSDQRSKGWQARWRDIGWEEAMRAWRIVSPSVFEALYDVPRTIAYERRRGMAMWQRTGLRWFHITRILSRERLREPYSRISYERWWEPASLLQDTATYFAGGFMLTMFRVVYLVVYCALAMMCASPLILFLEKRWIEGGVAAFTFGVVTTLSICCRSHVSGRREILESELLSIHACSVLWQVSVTAHFRALRRIGANKKYRVSSYRGYTRALGEQTNSFIKCIDPDKPTTVDDWLDGTAQRRKRR